jgi:hypothetical protein
MKKFECIISVQAPHLLFDDHAVRHIDDRGGRNRKISEGVEINYADDTHCTINFKSGFRVEFEDDVQDAVYGDSPIQLIHGEGYKFGWNGIIHLNAPSAERLISSLQRQYPALSNVILPIINIEDRHEFNRRQNLNTIIELYS